MLNEIIEKIKKLRTLSQNNSNVEEAATAARLADQLIVKHRIEEAQLEIERRAKKRGVIGIQKQVT